MKTPVKILITILSLLVLLLGSVVYLLASGTLESSVAEVMADGTVVPKMRVSGSRLEYLDANGSWQAAAELSEVYRSYVLELNATPQPSTTPAGTPAPTQTPEQTASAEPTQTPEPTESAAPTSTQKAAGKPASTPKATVKPSTVPTPTQTPKPYDPGTDTPATSTNPGNPGSGDGEDLGGGDEEWTGGYD